jgi:hypothetical protein
MAKNDAQAFTEELSDELLADRIPRRYWIPADRLVS